jgi:hypothetical protein
LQPQGIESWIIVIISLSDNIVDEFVLDTLDVYGFLDGTMGIVRVGRTPEFRMILLNGS